MSEPVLAAFEIDDSHGFFNVWRYDTANTQRILFMQKAKDRQEAIKIALEKINIETTAQECVLSPVFRDAMQFGVGAFIATADGIEHIPHDKIFNKDGE